MMKWRRQRNLAIVLMMALLACVIAIASLGFRTQTARAEVEMAKYTVLEERNGYEMRQYSPQILARVLIGGRPDGAMNRAFGTLAGYIFGGNRKKQPDGNLAEESQKIAMTTPVTMEPGGPEHPDANWVAFSMPSEFTMDSLPVPDNEEIALTEREGFLAAAIRFSGRGGMDGMQEHEELLRACLKRDGVEVVGTPIYARYDPPWTLPLLRRNEVILPVAAKDEAPAATAEAPAAAAE